MLFRLLVLIVRDSVIKLNEITSNVNNNLDKVLLAIVYTVDYGNIHNRSRFLLKLNSFQALHVRLVENRILKVGMQLKYVLLNSFFLCKI